MQHKIIIARHRPGLKTALIGGGAFALLVGAFALYLWTRATTVSDFARAQTDLERMEDERRALKRDLRAARAEIEELKGQLVYVQRSTEIDQLSSDGVRNSLGSLQAEVSDLKEQLAFYRSIVSPEQSRAGIRIYDFRLSKAESSDTFRYELVLIQAVRHERKIDGRILILIEGQQDHTRRSLSLEELAMGDAQARTFSFRYFEEISGEFRLPPGFRPEQVKVNLVAESNGQNVEQQFDWGRAFKV